MVAPALTDVDVSAISVPTKVEEELSVAELPTTQNTLHACAPFSRTTTLFDAVTRSEDAWNTNVAFTSP